jgi:hypothetical protein
VIDTQYRGRVDEYGAELAETCFICLWSLPLFPISSRWSTLGGASHPIRLHRRSVLAGYLRLWGPVIVFANLAAGLEGAVAPLMAAATTAMLTGLAWRWRRIRDDAARRRSDIHALAFGSRCEPAYLPADLRARLESDLGARWTAHNPDRSPIEVATYGATKLSDAVVAYGLLRLAEIRLGVRYAGELDQLLVVRASHAQEELGADSAEHPYRAPPANNAQYIIATLKELVGRDTESRASLHAATPPHNALLRVSLPRSACLLTAVLSLTYFAVQSFDDRSIRIMLFAAWPLLCAIWIYSGLRRTII